MEIIHENEYVYKMNDEIEPYLATHRQEGYVPGAEDHLHRKDTGIVGKINVQRYLAEKPKGVIIISHGFTEAAPKYDEMIYYFLKAGYHVYMPALAKPLKWWLPPWRVSVWGCARNPSLLCRTT